MQPEKRTVKDIKWEIKRLSDYSLLILDKRVRTLINQIIKENQPKIKELETELEGLRPKKKDPKPRWPENTPKEILDFCLNYWSGTTEYHTFRIHCWNEYAVWTGYPNGGYSTAGGWNPTPARFYMLSLTEKKPGCLHSSGTLSAVTLQERSGRTSQKFMQDELDKLASAGSKTD